MTQDIVSAVAAFNGAARLYALAIGDDGQDSGLLVEAFAADERLQEVGARDIIALSTSAHVALASLLGQPASLHISLADGTRTQFSGYISEAAMLGSNGGLARYRLRITPWLWLLTQVRNSRVWQDRSVTAIIDEVLQAYAPYALWRWSDEVASFMQDVGERSYCCQYRESDFDFIRRLLTEEGIAWRFEAHTLVLFADSSQPCATPEDASSAQAGGLRFHGARVGEPGDSVQALSARRSLQVGLSSVLSYDYKAKKAVAASVPANIALGGKNAPVLESYDTPGQYWYASAAQAQRYAQLQMQAHEARAQLWQARSTVRTLRAGTRFTLTQGPLPQADGAASEYVVLRVASIGVNNLPAPALEGLAELFGPIPELLEETVAEWGAGFPDIAAAIAQAQASGHANCIEMITASTPWRPLQDGSDARQHATPTALGSQSAIVVGADGNDAASGADEIYCDRLGRVRIRFHWQQETGATCWVRVAQRAAGGGMGSQFLPRIGQEVLVQFLENDIDRPVIVGALYNGQGEGGT
ncbi:type VI secretion system Vgr family protein, partial [Janthinobacterium lividum]|uniref:type VI secretion system Vgr family protein n=2 Tax=Janthinobacterium TaxID=29580 RepID=UPI001CD9AA71